VTYTEWLRWSAAYAVDHPDQRRGQALYNSLHQFGRQDLCERVIQTSADPFHDDRNILLFLQIVEALW